MLENYFCLVELKVFKWIIHFTAFLNLKSVSIASKIISEINWGFRKQFFSTIKMFEEKIEYNLPNLKAKKLKAWIISRFSHIFQSKTSYIEKGYIAFNILRSSYLQYGCKAYWVPLLIRKQLGEKMSKVGHHSFIYESYIEILYLLNGLFLNYINHTIVYELESCNLQD